MSPHPSARHSPRHYRNRSVIPRRRWPGRLLVAANIVVALSLVGAGSVYAYIKWRLDSIKTIAAPHLTQVASNPATKAETKDGLPPENILLIGNETRLGQNGFPDAAELTGSLSDVIMVVHLDPATGQASLLSIPRDLFVPMPEGSAVGPYEKIDAALNNGSQGPDDLIQAITDDLGIPINHYVELEFDGAEAMVNALGGIKMDFPDELYDGTSSLLVSTTGCQVVEGPEALALIRSRHLQYDTPGASSYPEDWPADPQSDLSRIARDQAVMRVLVSTAEGEGLTNPIKLNSFVGALVSDLVMDPGLKNQLTSLAVDFRNFDPTTALELTLPITQVPSYSYDGSDIGDVDFADQAADNATIAAWDGTALPTPVPPTSVQVENMTDTNGLAAGTTAALVADGLPATTIGDVTVPAEESETLVEYAPVPGQLAQALDVEDHLLGAVMLQPNPSQPPGTVTVEVGSTVAVKPPSVPAPAGSTPGTTVAAGQAPAGQPAGQPATTPAPTTTVTVPTPFGQAPSPSTDTLAWWDPRPCT